MDGVLASPMTSTGPGFVEVQVKKTPQEQIADVFKANGLAFNGLKEGQLNGKSVMVLDMPQATIDALRSDDELLGRVKGGMECAGGIGVGLCVGLLYGCIMMTPFAIAGGTCLGVGNTRLAANPNDASAQELANAGKWVLVAGGCWAGAWAILGGCLSACGVCLSFK